MTYISTYLAVCSHTAKINGTFLHNNRSSSETNGATRKTDIQRVLEEFTAIQSFVKVSGHTDNLGRVPSHTDIYRVWEESRVKHSIGRVLGHTDSLGRVQGHTDRHRVLEEYMVIQADRLGRVHGHTDRQSWKILKPYRHTKSWKSSRSLVAKWPLFT